MIKNVPYILGPLENNSYLIFDEDSRTAYVVDPSFDPQPILETIHQEQLTLKAILLTHAHFDHLGGAGQLVKMLPAPIQIALSPKDAALYKNTGGASQFSYSLGELPKPTMALNAGQFLPLGQDQMEIREVPGHTPGHILIHVPSLKAAYCGDLIFHHSIGRTDLPGGDYRQLLQSIRTQVFTLPPETTLFPGHGPSTTVAEEMAHNPFLA
jgi:glyoxylase-like metal-dependent hydrolase (beta-lactamase superfamily II)